MLRHIASTMILILVGVFGAGAVIAPTPAFANEDWENIRGDYFGDREILDGSDVMAIDAPDKAEDAAIVPLEVFMFSRIGGNVKKLTMLIDRNPMPLVAAVNFGNAAGSSSRTISTRVRFNSYSMVRAIMETNDGKLYMVSKFVIAAGGCSSNGTKDLDVANNNIGKVRIKRFTKPGANPNQSSSMAEAQVMIRHPNYSGMQMDPTSGDYIPAHFVNEIVVKRGEDLIFDIEAGISLSENPHIRFTYAPGTGEPIAVSAKDSEGGNFSARLGKKVSQAQ